MAAELSARDDGTVEATALPAPAACLAGRVQYMMLSPQTAAPTAALAATMTSWWAMVGWAGALCPCCAMIQEVRSGRALGYRRVITLAHRCMI